MGSSMMNHRGQAVESASIAAHPNQEAVPRSTNESQMRVRDQVSDNSSEIVAAAGDAVSPAPPERNDGEFRNEGPVWWVGLSNDQTRALESVLGIGGGSLSSLSGPLWPVIGAALAASVGYI